MNSKLAWHFVGDTLRKGTPIPPTGTLLKYYGRLRLCVAGLHASENILDALYYSPGLTCCRVRCDGDMVIGSDKFVCAERTILWRVDAKEAMGEFARWCAMQVIDLWDAPDVVRQYLEMRNKSLWNDARRAVLVPHSFAEAAAEAAIRCTIQASVLYSPLDTFQASVWDTAWYAARATACDASWAGSQATAWDDARFAARDISQDDEGCKAQNRMLERLIRRAANQMICW